MISQAQCPRNQAGSLIKCCRGHWMLTPGTPAIRELVVPPISHKACRPVEEWHVPRSLACERDQAQISRASRDESENKV